MKAAFMVVAVLAAVAWTAHATIVCTGDVPEGEIEYHPHPCNCSKIYACMGTELILLSCPKGLHWNQQKRICDLPNNVNCHKQPGC